MIFTHRIMPNYIESHYVYSDEFGAYRNVFKGARHTQNGESGKAWMGVDPSETGHHYGVRRKGTHFRLN